MKIKVNVKAVDGYRAYRTFDNLEAARRFAHRRAGTTPEVSVMFGYAVAADGVLTVTVSGDATLADVFPGSFELEDVEEPVLGNCSWSCESWFRNGSIACDFCPRNPGSEIYDDHSDEAVVAEPSVPAPAVEDVEAVDDPDDIPF